MIKVKALWILNKIKSNIKYPSIVRISIRGVPHLVITDTDRRIRMSACYFQADRFIRVFWPYPSMGQVQNRRDFKIWEDAVNYINSGKLPAKKEGNVIKIVDTKPQGEVVELKDWLKQVSEGFILMAEKGDKQQDILVYIPEDNRLGSRIDTYQWSSLYCRKAPRTRYLSIEEAIKSRLEQGMTVYTFKNRGEFRQAIKYNGERM